MEIMQFFLKNPFGRTLVQACSVVFSAILSGVFVIEITSDGEVYWESFYKSSAFYGLVILGFVTYFYNREIYLRDKKIEQFMDEEFCRAYTRAELLPEITKKKKDLIQETTDLKNLKKMENDLYKSLSNPKK